MFVVTTDFLSSGYMESSEDAYKSECFSTGDSPLWCESRMKVRKDLFSKVTTYRGSKNHPQSFDSSLTEEDGQWEGESSSPPPPSGTFSPLTPSVSKELNSPLVLDGDSLFTGSLSPDVKERPFSLVRERGKSPPSSIGYARGQSTVSGFESSARVRLSPLRRNGNSSFSCTIWEKKVTRSIPHVPDSRTQVHDSQCSLQVDSTSTLQDNKNCINCITLNDVEQVVSFVMDRILFFVSSK